MAFIERVSGEFKVSPVTGSVEIYSADWKKYQEVRQKAHQLSFFLFFPNSEKMSARGQSYSAQGDSCTDACQVVQCL